MTVAEIPCDFIKRRVEASWSEIKFGIDHRLVKPKLAIEKASEQLCGNDFAPHEIVELASLREDESVVELVSSLARAEAPVAEDDVKAKWLYLVLAWLFENRESLVDPLELVETVYSDFDYPRELAPFVRYMPMDGPDLGGPEQNEARMFEHWKEYLGEAAKRFGRPEAE